MFRTTLVAVALSSLAFSAGAQVKWDLASAYPASNFHSQNLAQFVKDVGEATGGKLDITLHAGASLFKAPEIKRAVQGNQIQAGEILLSGYQNEWQIFGLDGIPFLATGYAQARKLYDAQKPSLDAKLASQGMMVLYTVAWQPQGLYVKNKIDSLSALKDSKWRAYSPATARIAELVGAQPVTVQAAELSQAMATGVVESFMTSSSTGYDSKTFEYIKNYYTLRAWLPKNAVLVNAKAFNDLDKPTQAAVLAAAHKAEERGWALSEKKDLEYLEQLKANGMDIIEPSDGMKRDFAEKVGKPMLDEWLAKTGDEGQAIIKAFRKD